MNWALVLMAILWAAILLPGAIRSRRRSPLHSVGGFEHAMRLLEHGPADGRYLMVPQDAGRADRIVRRTPGEGEPLRVTRVDPMIERRRRTFTIGVGIVTSALLISLVAGGPVWLLFFGSAAALMIYSAVLRQHKLQRDRAREVVRELEAFREEPVREQPVHEHVEERVPVAAGAALQVASHPSDPWEQGAGVRLRRWDA